MNVFIGSPGVDLGAAGVNVDGSEIIFGPGVDGQMGLGNDDHAGNAVGAEIVEHHVHNVCLRVLGGAHHDLFNTAHVRDNPVIALIHFDEKMTA